MYCFKVLKPGCSLLRARGFVFSLYVIRKGQGIINNYKRHRTVPTYKAIFATKKEASITKELCETVMHVRLGKLRHSLPYCSGWLAVA